MIILINDHLLVIILILSITILIIPIDSQINLHIIKLITISIMFKYLISYK